MKLSTLVWYWSSILTMYWSVVGFAYNAAHNHSITAFLWYCTFWLSVWAYTEWRVIYVRERMLRDMYIFLKKHATQGRLKEDKYLVMYDSGYLAILRERKWEGEYLVPLSNDWKIITNFNKDKT